MAINYGLCIYNNQLYSILGSFGLSDSVIKINLMSENYELERIRIDRIGKAESDMGYYFDENLI